MFEAVRISPSILSADFMNMERDIRALENAGADWVHVDVMDGHFVPNLTLGVPFTAQLRKITKLPLDVHLMIDNPLTQLPWFIACEPDIITVHWEALDAQAGQPAEAARSIREAGIKAGVALKPDTPIEVLADTIGLWDMVLVMSVYPGFSGQSYIEDTGPRIAALRTLCEQAGASPIVQVDGGIGIATSPKVCCEGADALVAGNAVFKSDDVARAIAEIRRAGEESRRVDMSHGEGAFRG